MKIFKPSLIIFLLIFSFQFSKISLANVINENKKKELDYVSNIDSLFKYFRIIDINRLKIPIKNNGVLSDFTVPIFHYNFPDQFDENNIIYSGGFFLTGKNNDQIWANGVATSSRILDYVSGKVGSNPADSLNIIYVVKSSDPPFGKSWQEYRNAVLLGAEFYDGDNDGKYDPVDKNLNGKWDLNEDRPLILGDYTAWFVINDGMASQNRRFQSMFPFGIEIQQTVFAVGDSSSPLYNTIFFRYKIINRGTVNAILDSVYFLFWADADISDYQDDLIGSDSVLNAVFTYNKGSDHWYGHNPPAVSLVMLQGPVVYLPGETFIDVNSNGIYNAGIDIPFDTAKVNLGFLGVKKFFGAKNQSVKTLFYYINSNPPILNDPHNVLDAWNYARGLNKRATYINPCEWAYGSVFEYPCNLVNPIYIFSGDPVSRIGWIDTTGTDVRMFVSTGPFKLELNEPAEMWFAIVAGRGESRLSSVNVLKQNINEARKFYLMNFGYPDQGNNNGIIKDFRLYQNYPNPFNSETTIKFLNPEKQFITLKVYDILGREIKTLVDGTLEANEYSVKFKAENLSSGIYIYELRSGKNAQAKKMVYIK